MKIVEREIKDTKGCDERRHVSCLTSPVVSRLTSHATAQWPKVKLGDVCIKIVSGGTPSTKHSEYYGGVIPWLRTQEVDFKPIFSTELSISEAGLENSSAKWIPANTVVVAMYGATAGRSAIARIPLTTNQACCNLVVDDQAADYRFVYYAFRLLYEELEGLAKGSAQTNLSLGIIKSFRIPLPPLPVQRRIADVLSAYDDLIENNRRRIAILEETARLAYRKWFGGTEQGRTATLGEIAPFVRGKVITQKNAVRGKVPVVAGGLDPAYFHNVANTGAPVITISGSGANAGFARMYFEPIWASDCSWCDKSKTKCFYFVYCFLKDKADALRNLQQGAAQPHVYPKDINALEVALPKSDDLLDEFEEVVEPLFSQCGVLAKQNAALAATRDLLLPRLMKGGAA